MLHSFQCTCIRAWVPVDNFQGRHPSTGCIQLPRVQTSTVRQQSFTFSLALAAGWNRRSAICPANNILWITRSNFQTEVENISGRTVTNTITTRWSFPFWQPAYCFRIPPIVFMANKFYCCYSVSVIWMPWAPYLAYTYE